MSSRPNSATDASTRRSSSASVGDVGAHGEGAPAGLFDQPRHLVEVGRRPGRQHDVGPRLGEADGDAAADPQPGSGDDGDAVVEAEAVEDHERRARSSDDAARPATNGISR